MAPPLSSSQSFASTASNSTCRYSQTPRRGSDQRESGNRRVMCAVCYFIQYIALLVPATIGPEKRKRITHHYIVIGQVLWRDQIAVDDGGEQERMALVFTSFAVTSDECSMNTSIDCPNRTFQLSESKICVYSVDATRPNGLSAQETMADFV